MTRAGFTLLTAMYGGAHLSAWRFPFPTPVEMWLWRGSGLALASLPVFTFILACDKTVFKLLADIIEEIRERKNERWPFTPWWLAVFLNYCSAFFWALLAYPVVFIYLPGRVYVFAEALASLRAPPLGTYDTVRWTSFLPHGN